MNHLFTFGINVNRSEVDKDIQEKQEIYAWVENANVRFVIKTLGHRKL